MIAEMPRMYCVSCHYDLRGLDSSRCPECGLRFDPNNARTYSTDNRSHLLQDAADFLMTSVAEAADAVIGKTPPPPAFAAMRRSATKLWLENQNLRAFVGELLDRLVAEGAITAEQAAVYLADAEEATNRQPRIEDDPEVEDEGEETEPSEELRSLAEAVRQQQRTGG